MGNNTSLKVLSGSGCFSCCYLILSHLFAVTLATWGNDELFADLSFFQAVSNLGLPIIDPQDPWCTAEAQSMPGEVLEAAEKKSTHTLRLPQ